jgi:hypothetical protein
VFFRNSPTGASGTISPGSIVNILRLVIRQSLSPPGAPVREA